MPQTYTLFLAILSLGALSACSYQYDKQASEESGVSGAVGFEEVRAKVLTVSCQRCHDKTLPHFNDFPSAHAAREAIRRSVFETKTMPKSGELTAKQTAILFSWLSAGAPEAPAAPGAPSPSGGLKADGKKLLWRDLRAQVLDVSCNGCHGPRNKKGISDFTSLQNFRASISTVLYLSLVEKKKPMPPPPALLTEEEKKLLAAWIIDGELDDEGKGPNPGSEGGAPEVVPQENRISYHLQRPERKEEGIRFEIGYFLGTHRGSAREIQAVVEARNDEHFEITSASFRVPVESLRTGDEARDCHVREALGLNYTKSAYPGEHICDGRNSLRDPLAFPEIRLELKDHPVAIPAGETFADMQLPATLTIHGVARANTLIPVHLEFVNGSKRKLHVTSQFTLSLKDFGIVVKPVFLSLGVHDQATVHIDLTLASGESQAPGPFESKTVSFVVDPAQQQGGAKFEIDYFAGTHHGLARSTEGELELQLGENFSLSKARFRVPVESLDTENSTRNCHLHESLGLDYTHSRFPGEHVCDSDDHLPSSGPDSPAFPFVEFELEDYAVPSKQKSLLAGDTIDLLAKMRVKLHGVTKEGVSVPARLHYTEAAKGLLVLETKFSLSLADYGVVVKPVVGNFGTVADEVRVHVVLGFTPRAP